MLENSEKLGINLIEKEASYEESKNIFDYLPKEVKEDLEEKEYQIFGEGKNSFLVLPEAIEESFHEQIEYFSNADLINYKKTYLIFGLNEDKKLEEVLLTFEQLKADGVTFTDPRPLEFWNEILETQNDKRKKKCIYKSNKGFPTIAYDNWIIGTKANYKVSEIGITNSNSVYLEKEVTQDKYEKILKKNKR